MASSPSPSPVVGFLGSVETTDEVQRLYDGDVNDLGYVMNLSKAWAHEPELIGRMRAVFDAAAEAGSLTFRQRGILIAASASTLGDSYCSLAWGKRLATAAGDEVAGGVLRGDDEGLDESERTLARWARKVAKDANGTTPDDVQALRDAGFDDSQIFALTLFVAARMAFSTVNDALGVRPDHELGSSAPEPVLAAVTYGRPIADTP